MPREDFEKLVAQGFEQLPEWVRKKINNVAILVEDEPSQEDREENGLADNETLLGLYKGIPLSARGENYGGLAMPDTITLFQLPIEDAAEESLSTSDVASDIRCRYKEAVKRVVAETIWHEFAHHFGIDEEEVRKREEGRTML